MGSVEDLEAHGGMMVLNLREGPEDPRDAWRRVCEALGSEIRIEPALMDANGEAHYPTGRIAVRFRETPSDTEIERFATEHGLQVHARNRYVPVQVEFEPLEPGRQYLPDVLEEIEVSRGVHAAWAQTLSRYRRA
jgi:hypothetical protein